MSALAIMPDETIMYIKTCINDNDTKTIIIEDNTLDIYLKILKILYTINIFITLSTFFIFESFVFIGCAGASIIGFYGACFKKKVSLALCICGIVIDIITKFIFIESESFKYKHIHDGQIMIYILLPSVFILMQFFIGIYTLICVSNFD